METNKPISFGELLRTYRKRRGQTQQQLARKLDTHQNTIGAWERGDYLPATRGIILELGHCLHLDEAEARDLLEASLLTVTSRWSVPYQRNPFFTGRQAVLQQLHLLLSEEQQPPFSRSYALRGMGGVGKTQIAVEYVYRHVRDYNAIFWINTETEEDLLGSVAAMAAILKLPVPSIQERDVVLTLVLNWLQTHRDWLLLFDNVEDSAFIQRFVPAAHNGSFLMTTRLPTLGTLAPCLELQPLSQQESVQLLLSRAGVQPPHRPSIPLKEEEVEAVHAIAAAMDGLPLALDQAAAYIEESQCGFVEFLFLLRHHELQVLQTHPTSMAYPRSVERTFTLAFESLRQQNQVAAEILTLCCFLAPDEIPETLLSQGVPFFDENLGVVLSDLFQLQATFKDLLTYALLYRNAQTRTFRVHRLVQTILKAQLSEAVQRIWVRRLICLLDHLFLIKPFRLETEHWDWCEQLLPHAYRVLQANERFQLVFGELGSLLQKLAIYLLQRQRYEQAERFHYCALHVQEQVLGKDHPEVALTLASLARTFEYRANYQQVEHLYRRAIALLEAHGRTEDPRLVFPLQGLASFCTSMGRYVEAEGLYQQAVRICTQQEEPDYLDLATTFHELAVCYSSQGKYTQAESLYLRALQILEKLLPSSHLDIATLLDDLAILYFCRASYQQAEQLFLRCLSLYEQTIGSQRTEVAATLGNLAWLYQKQDKYERAEQLYRRELALCEQVVGPEDLLVARALAQLALLYSHWGKDKYDQAESLAERALSIYGRSLPADHRLLSNPLHTLALLAYKQGSYEQAEALVSRAFEIRERTLPAVHVDLAFSLHLWGKASLAQGKAQEAERRYMWALNMYQKTLGSDHLDMALFEDDFARLLQSQRRWREAEQHYQRALRIWEQFSEFNHSDHINCIEHYVELLRQQQRRQEADDYYLLSQEMRARRQAAPYVGMQELRGLSETTGDKKPFQVNENEETDLFELFLQECCVLCAPASCQTSDLWQAYQRWMQAQEGALLLSRHAFALRLKAKKCHRSRTNRQRFWQGIGLKNLATGPVKMERPEKAT